MSRCRCRCRRSYCLELFEGRVATWSRHGCAALYVLWGLLKSTYCFTNLSEIWFDFFWWCQYCGSCQHKVGWQIPPDHTFFTGEVGVVTWLAGLVGDDTVILVGVGVVLLLTDAEGLLLSGGVKKGKSVSCLSRQTRTDEKQIWNMFWKR